VSPSWRRCAHRCRPTNPAAPVTSALMSYGGPHGFGSPARQEGQSRDLAFSRRQLGETDGPRSGWSRRSRWAGVRPTRATRATCRLTPFGLASQLRGQFGGRPGFGSARWATIAPGEPSAVHVSSVKATIIKSAIQVGPLAGPVNAIAKSHKHRVRRCGHVEIVLHILVVNAVECS
jgi:hypothetical protein